MRAEGRTNVEWLLHEGASTSAMRVGERNVVESESLRAVIECVDLGAGLRVYLTDATAFKDVTVEPRAERTDCWIGSQTTVAGHARIDFLDGPRAEVNVRSAILFRAARRAATYSLAAGTRFHSAGYGLDIERVKRLFDGNVPAVLRPLLAREMVASRVVSMRLDRWMRDLARHLFARGLNGPLRMLTMEGAVIQLLALQAAAMGSEPVACTPLTRREQQKVREARERLLSDMRAPPSLGALASMVSLSEKKLNAGFRALFGTTVYETLRNERLEHARLALEDGQLALKDVARRVGYNHVTNFISAFTARYGAPPRRHLRAD
jgi:AraC-like DNA-binding protein